ncbi:hypothetical protein C8Q74DRAFT_1250420 [Fomes fomentarius]|nr:hypothetical protein C8Q74DRAFT_1250420 [Fomes fomentarius]
MATLTGLLFYDWIINIEKDISLVWRYERVTLPKTLYIATRYLWLVFVVLDIATTIPIDIQACKNIVQIQKVSSIIRYIPWAVFAGLRTYALTSRNVLLTAIVVTLALAIILPGLYTDTYEWVVDMNVPLPGCYYRYTINNTTLTPRLCHESVIYASRGATIASEAIVSIITWKKTYKYSRAAIVVGKKESLPEILLRNGEFAPSMLTATTLVLSLRSIHGELNFAAQTVGRARDMLTTVLISRFLLDLLEAGARSNATETSDPTLSSGLLTTQVTHEASFGDTETDLPPETSEGTVRRSEYVEGSQA